ncbi:MAG: hypothetical protein AB1894_16885 [Chloroflexota bacterium]
MTPDQIRAFQRQLRPGEQVERAPDPAGSTPTQPSDGQSEEQPFGSSIARIVWGPPTPAPLPDRTAPSRARRRKPPSEIDWQGGGVDQPPDPASLIGIEDAFDHTPLIPGEKIAFCKLDRVAYHIETWQFLRAENRGRCCICGRSEHFIFLTLPGSAPVKAPIPAQATASLLRPGEQIIRLEEVHNHVNKAVIVQGYVHEVYKTRNTGTHFIRFEPRQFNEAVYAGFKVVIFPRYEQAWAQAGLAIKNYLGQNIRVRGVIQVHPDWGIEILVNSPRVIEIVVDQKPEQAEQV